MRRVLAENRNRSLGERVPGARAVRSPAIFAMIWLAACIAAPAQQGKAPASPTIATVMEAQLNLLETQFVPAAEAMPEEKYSFTPAHGEFTSVRTFALEIKHVATANFVLYSAILDQAPPPGVNLVGAANGPEDLQTKEQIVTYLKDSFALGHKAMASLTAGNLVKRLDHPPINWMNTRLALATFSMTHAWDHYGQVAEYLRLNGIVPPASQGQPPANPPRK
jgi:hypothetical protein